VNALRILEGDLNAGNLRIALVASRFNEAVVERLVAGAVDALAAQGADPETLELIRVPGASLDGYAQARRAVKREGCVATAASGAGGHR
jgi:6,7-dimethyl-8-ribityllumazine synthase